MGGNGQRSATLNKLAVGLGLSEAISCAFRVGGREGELPFGEVGYPLEGVYRLAVDALACQFNTATVGGCAGEGESGEVAQHGALYARIFLDLHAVQRNICAAGALHGHLDLSVGVGEQIIADENRRIVLIDA